LAVFSSYIRSLISQRNAAKSIGLVRGVWASTFRAAFVFSGERPKMPSALEIECRLFGVAYFDAAAHLLENS
jgi:hypothetical protein